MGILVVNDYATCTHLAAPRILKTQKFICGLAHSPVVLSTDFIDNCLSEGKAMDYATAVWKRLPLGMANTLGPLVSPGLPW